MDRFPTETIYYKETDLYFAINSLKMKEDFGEDLFYKATIRDNNHSNSEFAQLMWLYKEEFHPLLQRQKEKCDALTESLAAIPPGRKRLAFWADTEEDYNKAARRMQFLCIMCETKGTRMFKEQEVRDWMALGEDTAENHTADIYIKGYLIYEKGMRFAYNGNRAKAEKYIQKKVVYLAELWEYLKDRDEAGGCFSIDVPDGAGGLQKLTDGAAFQPILDSIKKKIENVKEMVELFC